MTRRSRGVSLVAVLVGALVAAAALAGLVRLAEGLRHPAPPEVSAASGAEVEPTDPRIDVDCPSPEPREGLPRQDGSTPIGDPVDVSPRDLLECPQTYDGALVSYEGEVVGAVMERDDGAWVRINDDPYAREPGPLPGHREYRGANEGIAVLLPGEAADEVDIVGGAGRRGDAVAVTGVFHRVDERTGGVAVIRAATAQVVGGGSVVTDARLPARERAAAALAALAAALVTAERLHARRWRRG